MVIYLYRSVLYPTKALELRSNPSERVIYRDSSLGLVSLSLDGLSMTVLKSEPAVWAITVGSMNRPNQAILVTDWLITKQSRDLNNEF